jgi:DNA repair protein RecN (Recombination protein N)
VLEELVIENYAVVDRLEVRFHPGLNLLTGETGSGKSIVVDALGLLLGSRASTDMIRSGAERARVSGVFEAGPAARKLLAEAGFEGDGAELLLDREILSTGKGRVWINNRPATVALLKDLAPHLGDIHGQHDQQLLFDPEAQLDLLDAFAANEKLRVRTAELFAVWKKTAEAIRALESSEQEKLRLLDLWQFQRREIEAAELKPGEDAELEAERRIQQNAGRLLENAGAAYEALYDSPESALTLARAAAKKIDELARIDPAMESVRQSLEPALITIQDVAYSLRDYLGRVEANPARLEEVEARLVAIERLKRKYGGSVEEIIAFGEEAARNIAEVETSGERLEELKRERQGLAGEFEKQAAELSAGRKAAALRLAKRVEQELKPLAMERTRFEIQVEAAEWSESGADRVTFLVAPNVGEEPRPLESVASGGELSRIALALKTCLVGGHRSGPPRTLVFDEIDAGIGGRAAEGVARRLRSLAAENQVLCVTHLAQIACFADHHYRVGKSEQSGRTVAQIEELSQKESTEEIGRMLSGRNVTPEALRNAAELIRSARADTLVSEA